NGTDTSHGHAASRRECASSTDLWWRRHALVHCGLSSVLHAGASRHARRPHAGRPWLALLSRPRYWSRRGLPRSMLQSMFWLVVGGAIVAGVLRVWRAIIARNVSRAISTAGAAGGVVGPSVVPSV